MEYFDPSKNRIFFGSIDKLPEWTSATDHSKTIDKIRIMLKNYLELDNVSFLFGSGTSLHLGAVTIRNFPREIEEYIKNQDNVKGREGVYKEFTQTVEKLQGDSIGKLEEWEEKKDDENLKRIKSTGDIAVEFERILNFVIAKDYVNDEDKSEQRVDKIKELIICIKEGLFSVCDIDKPERKVPDWLVKKKQESNFESQKVHAELLLKETKYIFHEKFIKALLQRPLNLKRANLFTANYDLSFEYAFDRLGVHYIDGFAGFHKRFFKPETFNYDIFYPGSTTAGKVQRIEKVVRYFKLHGSLSWINSEKRDSTNLYGIEEMALPLIEKQKKKGEIIIYPTAVKKSYTLDLPYSELFRQFASTITQSQSVLITIGYAFADEHFNDIIFQALSNPTFTLIIVDFYGVENNPNLERLKNLNDSRIILLQGEFFGDFLTFSDILMPNFNNIEYEEKVANTLNEYFTKETPKEKPE
jgi:hypothetical protein